MTDIEEPETPTFDLYRVPAETKSITYTDEAGSQRAIGISTLEPGYAYAVPESQADVAILEGFGWTRVARKAMGELDHDDEPDPEPQPAIVPPGPADESVDVERPAETDSTDDEHDPAQPAEEG